MSRLPKVINFISSKGGSGKTVISASLGTLLSELGVKTLIIDTDAATNGLTLLYLENLLGEKKARTNIKSFGLFEVPEDIIPDTIRITSNLSVVPASFVMRDTEGFSENTFENALKTIIKSSNDFDVIIIDAQAGVDQYARISTKLSEVNVIVSEYDPISAQGIDRLKAVFANELKIESSYTLFNKILPEFADVVGDGLVIARYLPPIPWDADVVRAFAKRDLAIDVKNPNSFTLAISQIALSCLAEISGKAIENWRGYVIDRKSAPIETRLKELQNIKQKLESKKSKLSFYRAIIRSASISLILVISSAMFLVELFKGSISSEIFESNILILISLASLSLISLYMALKDVLGFHDEVDIKTDNDLDVEIEKLSASLNATKSVLEVKEPGFYSKMRRVEYEEL